MDTTITRISAGHPAGGQFTGMKRPEPPFRLVAPLSDIEAVRLKHALRNAVTDTGGPLSPDARTRITAVVANPTSATWEDAYSIAIDDMLPSTVWGNVLKHTEYTIDRRSGDPDQNSMRSWAEIPTREQILIGLELGTKGNR